MSNSLRVIQVVAGIIENETGEILLAERPPGKYLAGLWEFPGGKIEVGEQAEDALARELKEELELDVRLLSRVGTFPFSYPNGTIELQVFHVRALSSPQTTADVQRFKWARPHQILEAELTPADVEPLRAFIERML